MLLNKAITEAQITAMGMVAENQLCLGENCLPKYGEQDFQRVLGELEAKFEAHRL